MNDYTEERRKLYTEERRKKLELLESLGLVRSPAEEWWALFAETMRLGARAMVLVAAIVEWGWLRGLGAAFAVLILEDAMRGPKR